jgi:hypothetical protein
MRVLIISQKMRFNVLFLHNRPDRRWTYRGRGDCERQESLCVRDGTLYDQNNVLLLLLAIFIFVFIHNSLLNDDPLSWFDHQPHN